MQYFKVKWNPIELLTQNSKWSFWILIISQQWVFLHFYLVWSILFFTLKELPNLAPNSIFFSSEAFFYWCFINCQIIKSNNQPSLGKGKGHNIQMEPFTIRSKILYLMRKVFVRELPASYSLMSLLWKYSLYPNPFVQKETISNISLCNSLLTEESRIDFYSDDGMT